MTRYTHCDLCPISLLLLLLLSLYSNLCSNSPYPSTIHSFNLPNECFVRISNTYISVQVLLLLTTIHATIITISNCFNFI